MPPAGAKMPQKVLCLFKAPPYAAARGADVAESILSGICRHQASRQAAMDDALG